MVGTSGYLNSIRYNNKDAMLPASESIVIGQDLPSPEALTRGYHCVLDDSEGYLIWMIIGGKLFTIDSLAGSVR